MPQPAPLVALLFVVLALLAAGAVSPLALASTFFDGLPAAAVLAGAGGLGLGCAALLDRGRRWPVRWHVVGGAGLGIGVLSLMVLAAGSAGGLRPAAWWTVLAAGWLIGAVRLWALGRAPGREDEGPRLPPMAPGFQAAWLLLVPSAALVLLCATVPPGIIWSEEARGYDVLEYHLQVPREHFDRGAVGGLPHNVYSYFPLNAEMLYLLAMVLRGDAQQAAVPAQLINAGLALLWVAAAWLAGREFSRPVGLAAGLLAGSAPWITYFSGLAYVENGMLLQGMLAAAALARFAARRSIGAVDLHAAALAGAYAGLSCGFKYLAVPMVAVAGAAALAVLLTGRAGLPGAALAESTGREAQRPQGPQAPSGEPSRRLAAEARFPVQAGLPARSRLGPAALTLSIFGLGAAVTFAPWLIRNAWLTGNPVFPLGYAWFGARQEVWTPQLAQLWERAHQVEPQHGSVRSRLVLLIRRVVLDGRLGPLTPLLAAGVLCCLGRSRWDAAWLAMLAVQVGVWIGCTHLYARFAAVLLIPLLLLAGRAADAGSNRGLRRLFGGALLAAVFLGHWQSWSLFAAELMPGGRPLRIQGMTEWMYQDEQLAELPAFLRSALPDGSRVLLVADAAVFYMPSNVDYAVVFSRNPFGEAVARAGSDAEIMAWLRERGYTHVVVNWSEMERLRRTYGFWEGIDVPLFERLQTAGLTVVKHFSAGDGRRYATCYAVEGPGRPR